MKTDVEWKAELEPPEPGQKRELVWIRFGSPEEEERERRRIDERKRLWQEAVNEGVIRCPYNQDVWINLAEPHSIHINDYGLKYEIDDGYWLPLSELRNNPPKLADWIAHLMEKPWMTLERWGTFMWLLDRYIELSGGNSYSFFMQRDDGAKKAKKAK